MRTRFTLWILCLVVVWGAAVTALTLDEPFVFTNTLETPVSGGAITLSSLGFLYAPFSGTAGDDGGATNASSGVGYFLLSKPLMYPNPIKMSSGGQIGYKLSRDMDVELRIYNMAANEVYKTSFSAGQNGGLSGLTGYNKVTIDTSVIGQPLPSGVYFFILVNQGKILGRGKFGVLPE